MLYIVSSYTKPKIFLVTTSYIEALKEYARELFSEIKHYKIT